MHLSINSVIEQHDEKMIRCTRVGGEINFRFCHYENNMLPCRFIVGWRQTHKDINEFLTEHYSEEELERIFVPRKPKMESLVDLMEKV